MMSTKICHIHILLYYVRFLAPHSGNPNTWIVNGAGHTPIDLAVEIHHHDMVHFLIHYINQVFNWEDQQPSRQLRRSINRCQDIMLSCYFFESWANIFNENEAE